MDMKMNGLIFGGEWCVKRVRRKGVRRGGDEGCAGGKGKGREGRMNKAEEG